MDYPFTEAEKDQVRNRLNEFKYWFEEWHDGSSPEDDIKNLTVYNSREFNKKLENWLYIVTVDYANHYKKIKTIVNFERCEMNPLEIIQQLSNLYGNGDLPRYGSCISHCFENFNILFSYYICMIRRVNEIAEYESTTGEPSDFVKRLLPVEPSKTNVPVAVKKSKRYIVNGILY